MSLDSLEFLARTISRSVITFYMKVKQLKNRIALLSVVYFIGSDEVHLKGKLGFSGILQTLLMSYMNLMDEKQRRSVIESYKLSTLLPKLTHKVPFEYDDVEQM